MKKSIVISEICHSLSDTMFLVEKEVINSLDSTGSIGKTRRRYAA